jgi:DNA-binding transcriptional regulator YhcF (GntR family)
VSRISPLDLAVDRAGDLPLATQLAWKLRTFVATGALAPGDRLPGVRELADAAGVNVNTVRSVYGRLEEDGLVTSQHGRGTFVAEHAQPRETLARIAAAAAEEARRAGVDPREVAAALFAGAGTAAAGPAADTAPEPGPAGGERARRRELRAEIARLEGELAYLEGLPPAPTATRRTDRGHLPDAAELEEIRDGLAGRLAEVREARAQTRRAAEARRAGAEAPAAEPRVWRHGGVWTGALKPGGVVYES